MGRAHINIILRTAFSTAINNLEHIAISDLYDRDAVIDEVSINV